MEEKKNKMMMAASIISENAKCFIDLVLFVHSKLASRPETKEIYFPNQAALSSF
jgi:hypothetical protein